MDKKYQKPALTIVTIDNEPLMAASGKSTGTSMGFGGGEVSNTGGSAKDFSSFCDDLWKEEEED